MRLHPQCTQAALLTALMCMGLGLGVRSTGDSQRWNSARAFWEEKLLGGHTIKEMQKHHPWIRPFDTKMTSSGRGQLTEKGAEQLHAVGSSLRLRYVHQAGFLPRTLNPADITVRSTPVPRCYQSAAALLLGLCKLGRPCL
jgi:hypothetical protein